MNLTSALVHLACIATADQVLQPEAVTTHSLTAAQRKAGLWRKGGLRRGGLCLFEVCGAGGGEELIVLVGCGVGDGTIGLENHLFNSKFINE